MQNDAQMSFSQLGENKQITEVNLLMCFTIKQSAESEPAVMIISSVRILTV